MTCYVLCPVVNRYILLSMVKLTAALAGPDGEATTMVPALLA